MQINVRFSTASPLLPSYLDGTLLPLPASDRGPRNTVVSVFMTQMSERQNGRNTNLPRLLAEDAGQHYLI